MIRGGGGRRKLEAWRTAFLFGCIGMIYSDDVCLAP
jgi:hypothetical protein